MSNGIGALGSLGGALGAQVAAGAWVLNSHGAPVNQERDANLDKNTAYTTQSWVGVCFL